MERRTLRLSGSPTQLNNEARSWRVRSKRLFERAVHFISIAMAFADLTEY